MAQFTADEVIRLFQAAETHGVLEFTAGDMRFTLRGYKTPAEVAAKAFEEKLAIPSWAERAAPGDPLGDTDL